MLRGANKNLLDYSSSEKCIEPVSHINYIPTAQESKVEPNQKFILGQYFTKKPIVKKVFELLLSYKSYDKDIRILEPSAGTRNFVAVLNSQGFNNIVECEIDENLTHNPKDFFEFSLNEKFDLIIGNPPFTKYNVPKSYYYPKDYKDSQIKTADYLDGLKNKEKTQIEKPFILKAIKHLKDKNSTIAFVLPISFFIANKNKETKQIIADNFSTIIIYQNDKNWFEEPIPCCFAIFTNIERYNDKIIMLYEDGEKRIEILEKDKLISEELIPKSYIYKKNNKTEGIPLQDYLIEKKVKYNRDYKNNNISGANILEKTKIPNEANVEEYLLAVVRVGNSSVGKCGFINKETDILNDMFYVFDFQDKFKNDKTTKEKVCEVINKNQEHIRNLTVRVGSKSIKKSDVMELRLSFN